MKLNEIGEFGFIERFSPAFDQLLTRQMTGIGDDCAILPMNETEDLLVTTDLLMEDVHFLRDEISPQQLGYKSVAVNLSDIAAMGGEPLGTFLSIAIPPETEVEYLDALMEGYQEISRKYKVPLLGGDTTRSVSHLAINVCVVGKCAKGKARLRSMAQVDDVVCVTGFLGDSAGGLQVVLNRLKSSPDREYLLARHYLPEPRLAEGRFLSSLPGVHAMMDISDGIASDLKHILKTSGKTARINLDQLPVSSALTRICNEQGWNATDLAIGGGEDYELLLTVAPGQVEALQQKFQTEFGKALYPVGTIDEGSPVIRWFQNETEVQLSKNGFNHFL
ncbi:thiamine-phosphate kinase [Gaoshiqia sp. Z1-71]|uniref:thiamine-phosphate kinase n=1 Tax=Gaoshiqia hydrogeniformans TaxID=3290090 RepID=UPI003BF87301